MTHRFEFTVTMDDVSSACGDTGFHSGSTTPDHPVSAAVTRAFNQHIRAVARPLPPGPAEDLSLIHI